MSDRVVGFRFCSSSFCPSFLPAGLSLPPPVRRYMHVAEDLTDLSVDPIWTFRVPEHGFGNTVSTLRHPCYGGFDDSAERVGCGFFVESGVGGGKAVVHLEGMRSRQYSLAMGPRLPFLFVIFPDFAIAVKAEGFNAGPHVLISSTIQPSFPLSRHSSPLLSASTAPSILQHQKTCSKPSLSLSISLLLSR